MEKMAADYLRRARSRIIDAEAAIKRGDYPEVVRYSQEAVELSLKSCLRLIGIEYPKVHHVGDVLKLNRDRFPDWFRGLINEMDSVSAELALKRAPSMYGLELAGKGPGELFSLEEAKKSLSQAKFIYKNSLRVFKEITHTEV